MITTFAEPPFFLPIMFFNGSYEVVCGTVRDEKHRRVLVAVTRNKNAKDGVLYEPPTVPYIKQYVATHPAVVEEYGRLFRFPRDEAELHSLLQRVR